MTRYTLLIACLAAAFALAGCANRSDTIPTTGAGDFGSGGGAGGAEDASGASTSGAGGGSGIGVSPLDAEEQSLLNTLVVYFDFDKSDIRPEFNDLLAAHGHYLATHPDVQLRLEGHTDERGSREYNIGLGERRAQAVRRVLLLQGATAEQLSTVSYGEERPAALGSDEEAYSLNRRVELVYRQ
jgi:peptidoglycan-associated lipoprotein